jgi:hypothetical protein
MRPVWALAVTSLAVAIIAVACGQSPRGDGVRSDEAQSNYRILGARETARLMTYARSVWRCAVAHGLRLEAPRPTRTRIDLQPVGRWSPDAVVETLAECEPETGPPPPKSSLVAEKTRLVVYIPKRCLLDPKVAANAA